MREKEREGEIEREREREFTAVVWLFVVLETFVAADAVLLLLLLLLCCPGALLSQVLLLPSYLPHHSSRRRHHHSTVYYNTALPSLLLLQAAAAAAAPAVAVAVAAAAVADVVQLLKHRPNPRGQVWWQSVRRLHCAPALRNCAKPPPQTTRTRARLTRAHLQSLRMCACTCLSSAHACMRVCVLLHMCVWCAAVVMCAVVVVAIIAVAELCCRRRRRRNHRGPRLKHIAREHATRLWPLLAYRPRHSHAPVNALTADDQRVQPLAMWRRLAITRACTVCCNIL